MSRTSTPTVALEPHRERRWIDCSIIRNLPRAGDLSGTREELIDMAIARQAQRGPRTWTTRRLPRAGEHDS